MAKKVLIKIDKNGTEYWGDYTCDRCGGAGGSKSWQFTGWTCYKCGGSGRLDSPIIEKIYTPEYEEKLAEQRARRAEKKELKDREAFEAHREEVLESKWGFKNNKTYKVLGNTYEIKEELKDLGGKFDYTLGWHLPEDTDKYDTVEFTVDELLEEEISWFSYVDDALEIISAKIEALKPKTDKTSEYVGKVGERLTLTVKYVKSASFEAFDYSRPWKGETVTNYIHTFEDADGNKFVWRTGNVVDVKEGSEITLKGTIKEHKEYKGVKQTALTRCKVN